MAAAVKSSAETTWRATLSELELQMTKATFNTWLKDAVFLRAEKGVYVIGVRNSHAVDWLTNRLGDTIRRTLAAIADTAVDVRFVVVDVVESELAQDDEGESGERPFYSRPDINAQWYAVLKAYAEAQDSLQPSSCLKLLNKLDFLIDGTNLKIFSSDPKAIENLNRIANWLEALQAQFHVAGLLVNVSLYQEPSSNGRANGQAGQASLVNKQQNKRKGSDDGDGPVQYRNIRPPTDPLGSFVKTSHYAIRFWRPYLGPDVFDLLQIISSYAYEFEVLRKDGPTLTALINKMGRGKDTRKLTGRTGSGKGDSYREGSYGWLNELRDHRLCDYWQDGYGRWAKNYFDHLTKVSDLPLLTPKQVARLSPEDQAEHEEWLRLHTAVDYDEWSQDSRDSRIPELPLREDV
jgi:hypothetical protein